MRLRFTIVMGKKLDLLVRIPLGHQFNVLFLWAETQAKYQRRLRIIPTIGSIYIIPIIKNISIVPTIKNIIDIFTIKNMDIITIVKNINNAPIVKNVDKIVPNANEGFIPKKILFFRDQNTSQISKKSRVIPGIKNTNNKCTLGRIPFRSYT